MIELKNLPQNLTPVSLPLTHFKFGWSTHFVFYSDFIINRNWDGDVIGDYQVRINHIETFQYNSVDEKFEVMAHHLKQNDNSRIIGVTAEAWFNKDVKKVFPHCDVITLMELNNYFNDYTYRMKCKSILEKS